VSGRPRLLAVHAGAIGDLITALPALARMAAAGDLVVMGHGARIALVPHAIEDAQLLDIESAAFHTVFEAPSDTLRNAVRGIDAALAWFRDDDGALARGLQTAGIARVRTMPGVPVTRWHAHAVDYYHDCVDTFFAETGLVPPAMPRGERPEVTIAPSAPPCPILIHPGSGSATKNWPLASFAALGARLEAAGHGVAWLRGPAEHDWVLPGEHPVVDEPDLVCLAGMLAGARLFIGNDSGMAHLAAAAGCPVLAVFTASDPRLWAPRGPEVSVVGGLEAVDIMGKRNAAPSLDEVEACARHMLIATARSGAQ